MELGLHFGLTPPTPTIVAEEEELEEAPAGFAYIVNADSEYLVNADDAYVLAKV